MQKGGKIDRGQQTSTLYMWIDTSGVQSQMVFPQLQFSWEVHFKSIFHTVKKHFCRQSGEPEHWPERL